jgi:hypothetical protein
MEFSTDNAKLGGSYEVDAVYTLEIQLDPCEPKNPGDCEVDFDGTPRSTVDEIGPISRYFEDFEFQVGYIEEKIDINNFFKPLSRNFIWRPKTKFHSKQVIYTRLEFSQIDVATSSGWYGQTNQKH